MLGSLRDISLRFKITLAFVVLVLGGTSVSTYLGSRIITSAVLEEAQKRVRTGLETARMIYQMRLDRVHRGVVRCSSSEKFLRALQGQDDQLPTVLAALRAENWLDFLGFVDKNGRRVTSAGGTIPDLGDTPLGRLVRAATTGESIFGTEVLDLETLTREASFLVGQARMRIVPVPKAAPHRDDWLERGLVLFSTEPVRTARGTMGAIYGGVLLNRNTEVVDQVKQAVFGDERHEGRKVGTASIFLGDVRVSTNVMTGHERALGTRASAEVARVVLERGQPWLGRAFVVNDWFVTAYEPLRDHWGHIVGMLYVGVREAPYLAVRTGMMLTFLVVAGLGVLIVLGLTYVITRTMTRPLEEMVDATKKIAGGDLDQTVHVTSGDEIGKLAGSLNAMAASLKRARDELEEWTRTLEDRVRERSEELVRVQSKMAQAEKLASLGRMAAGVAHEINNPMGGILTFATLGLQDLPEDHAQRRNFEIIVKQTMRCRDIVKGLLEFSRQSEAKPMLTDITDVVDKTLLLMQQQTIFQNIRTTRRGSTRLPRVMIDPGQMQEVVLNLIINAVDAMEESGELEVTTGLAPAHNEVLVRIRDTGKGIPAEIVPLIFEPFFTTKEVGKGTGLGLAIVHGIVTRAGGLIEVDTVPGAGTTFTVRLPVADEPPPAEAQ
jgi:two-component system NtrC family sensor kinase